MIEIPKRLKKLCHIINGRAKPLVSDFEIKEIDPLAWTNLAINEQCAICGQNIGKFLFFVGTLGCLEHRRFPTPPLHLECAVYALQAYPQLFTLHRKEDAVTSSWIILPSFMEQRKMENERGAFILLRSSGYSVSQDDMGDYCSVVIDPSWPPQKVTPAN